MDWDESSIQGLKAQEAKDLAIDFLRLLEDKERGPISPGEVQLKELDLEVRLREAEIEDKRRREAHERQVKELELQIEREKTHCAEAESQADQIREAHARVIERVVEASESLSTQLERATREHNLKIEQLDSTFHTRQDEVSQQLEQLEQQRNALRDEIGTLTDLREDALEVGRLREEIEQRKKESRHEQALMEEEIAAVEFEKTKRIGELRRSQELELARLDTEHQKSVLQQNRQTAEAILESIGMVAVDKPEWENVHQRLEAVSEQSEHEIAEIRAATRDEVRRDFNITRAESVDVTDLYYRERAAQSEVERFRSQIDKMDAEIRRMREHIEQEPQRIAAAVEAAKTQVQNYIEQGGKR